MYDLSLFAGFCESVNAFFNKFTFPPQYQIFRRAPVTSSFDKSYCESRSDSNLTQKKNPNRHLNGDLFVWRNVSLLSLESPEDGVRIGWWVQLSVFKIGSILACTIFLFLLLWICHNVVFVFFFIFLLNIRFLGKLQLHRRLMTATVKQGVIRIWHRKKSQTGIWMVSGAKSAYGRFS